MSHAIRNLTLTQLLAWLLAGIVFLLPWQARLIIIPGSINGDAWEYGTISIYAIDILLFVGIMAGILQLLVTNNWKSVRLPQILALFLVIVTFFSMNFAGNDIVALARWWVFAMAAITFVLVSLLPISLRLACGAFIASATLQSIVAVTQFITQKVAGASVLGMAEQLPATLGVSVIEHNGERILRAYGSLPHPNMLAGFLVAAVLIALVHFIYTHSVRSRLLLTTALLLLGAGLWTTFSRQAFVALAVSIFILLVHAFAKREAFPKCAFIGITIVLLPTIVLSTGYPELVTTRANTESRLEQQSIDQRTAAIETSIGVLQNKWFTGVGIGNYSDYLYTADKKAHIVQPGFSYEPVHVTYLLVLAELGIFGFVGFVFFIFSIFFKQTRLRPQQLGFTLGFIALLIVGVFDHYLWSLHFGLLFFFLTAGFLQQRPAPFDRL